MQRQSRDMILPVGMSLDSLEARVALNLRKLGMKEPALHDIRMARVTLNTGAVNRLAQQIGVHEDELLRPLSDSERDEVAFYQAADMHVDHVAEQLRELAGRMGRGSQKRMAEAAGISKPLMNYLVNQRKSGFPYKAVMKFKYAQGIAETFGLEGDAWFVFDGAASPLPQKAKITSGLVPVSRMGESRHDMVHAGVVLEETR